MLVGSPCVRPMLERGLADFRWQGKRADEFNAITRAYYEQAALTKFANKRLSADAAPLPSVCLVCGRGQQPDGTEEN